MTEHERRHNVNESAQPLRASTKVKRGTGTRDQDTIDVKARGDDPGEVVDDLNEMVRLIRETADEARSIQPDSLFERVDEFNRNFDYSHLDNEDEFWVKHIGQQVDEIEEAFYDGDTEHAANEMADTILVAWNAIRNVGDHDPETYLDRRMEGGLNDKGVENIVEKYTEWWRSRGGGQ